MNDKWKLCAAVTLSALVLVPSRQLLSGTNEDQRILLMRHHDLKGQNLDYYVTIERLLRTPKWDLIGELPLSIPKAVSIAKDSLKGRIKPLQKTQIMRVVLERAAVQGPLEDYWHYTIDVAMLGEDYEARGPSIEKVVLLLDGTIVEPIATKD